MRHTLTIAVGLLALSLLAPVSIAAAEWVCRESSDYCAEVDGAVVPDARFFTNDNKEKLVVELPSLSMTALINMKTRKVITAPQESIDLEENEGAYHIALPNPSDAPVNTLSIDGEVTRFKVKDSEVHVLKASSCRPPVESPVPGAISVAAPPQVTDDLQARKCLQRDARPTRNTAGCLKVAYLRNSCGQPVVAVIRSTQHLFSGNLPQSATLVLPQGAEYELGCFWMSGATAPTDYEVAAAMFQPKQPAPDAGGHAPAKH
ncbi:MAG TPA: hypothetical protein VFW45_15520 [Candidatus Polarisedimenticolia bacterium]|nr:hypothetical protein [Candidatus Polarisedimenticolia bacterium]